MQSPQDDFFTKPYEDWATNPLARDPYKAPRSPHNSNNVEAIVGATVMIYLMIALSLSTAAIITQYTLLADYFFAPSFEINPWAWLAAIIISSIAEIFLIASKVCSLIRTRWSYILSAFPVFLLSSLLLFSATFNVAVRLWILAENDSTHGIIIVYQSKYSGSRGCGVQNSFYIHGHNNQGHWCSAKKIQTGTYPVSIKKSKLGILVVNPGLSRTGR